MSEGNKVVTVSSSEGLGFHREARLLTAADYSQVFKKSQRYSDHYWTVLVRHDDSVRARLGLAIAKKRAKRAVDRNKLKRVARESFRHHIAVLAGHELVIMNRDAAGSADKILLRKSIDKLMGKIVDSAARR